jgi:hypothetical protein
MVKQLQVMVDGKPSGKAFEAYSWDNGRSFCTDPKTTLAVIRRRNQLRAAARFTERERHIIDSLD